MKKEELLKRCRYYKGEEEYEGDPKNLFFWEAEEMYVKYEGTQDAVETIICFLECGLAGVCPSIPIELRAFLFGVYCHGADNSPIMLADNFEKSFLPNYLARPL